MDMNMITDFIQNMGFPIAVVIYLFYQQREEAKKHDEESKGFINAINNNSIVIQKLTDKLEMMEGVIKDGD